MAQMTVKAIQSLRNDALFWEKVTKMASEVDVGEPKLPRKRKVPTRFETGRAEGDFHSSPLLYYQRLI